MTTKTDDKTEAPVEEMAEAPDVEATPEPMPAALQAPTPEPTPPPAQTAPPAADPVADEKAGLRAELESEAERLNKFKRENIKKGDQTPCPACATLISVNANKCRHCSSDISAKNALTREILRKLDEVESELAALSPAGPMMATVKKLITRPTFGPEIKILLPSLVAYFGLVVALRYLAHPMIFWGTCVAGAVIGFVLFNRFRYAKFVTVESYRSVLVIGLLIVMGSALLPSVDAGQTVVVQKPVANIRQINTTDSDIMATARQGDKLRVFGEDNGWYNVRTADGKTGWIFGTLVSN